VDAMRTRSGEAGLDAFTIMRVARHSSATISPDCVCPAPQAVKRAFERLEVCAGTQKAAEEVSKVNFQGPRANGAKVVHECDLGA